GPLDRAAAGGGRGGAGPGDGDVGVVCAGAARERGDDESFCGGGGTAAGGVAGQGAGDSIAGAGLEFVAGAVADFLPRDSDWRDHDVSIVGGRAERGDRGAHTAGVCAVGAGKFNILERRRGGCAFWVDAWTGCEGRVGQGADFGGGGDGDAG